MLLLRSTRLSAWNIDYNYWSFCRARWRSGTGSTSSGRYLFARRLTSLTSAGCGKPPVQLRSSPRSWPPGRPDGQHGPGAARTARTAGRDGLSGNLSFSGLEALWVAGGGPAWAEYQAAEVGECESGGQQYAHNPSGADGYWQILGQVVPGKSTTSWSTPRTRSPSSRRRVTRWRNGCASRDWAVDHEFAERDQRQLR